ncbi:MAG: hypothetical protein IT450_02815 [Phycisphaerales bacterium]|nr:hypothetical protein [Phycisphaerales bacterium]
MYNMQPIRVLTLMIVITASIWMLLIALEGPIAGMAIGLLISVLCALVTLGSILTRRYVRGLVEPDPSESKHEAVDGSPAGSDRGGLSHR